MSNSKYNKYYYEYDDYSISAVRIYIIADNISYRLINSIIKHFGYLLIPYNIHRYARAHVTRKTDIFQ